MSGSVIENVTATYARKNVQSKLFALCEQMRVVQLFPVKIIFNCIWLMLSNIIS